MQNDRIQGILFDADMIVRFDMHTPDLSQKPMDVFKTFKKLRGQHNKNKAQLKKNKIVTDTLRYELMSDPHSYTTIRPLFRTQPKTFKKR
jgi:hypothetical protein